MKTIDARGLSCPEPVIRTKNALASGEKAYTVMVDNVTAKENVSRFALHQGYPATIMPVPRNLSSSCGTCVKFTGEAQTAQNWNSDEVEQLVKILETGSFQVIWHS